MSLLYGSNLAGVTAGILVPYAVPRLAFDFLPMESLTIGISAGVVSATGESENQAGVTNDAPSILAYALAPRVGYVLPITDSFYFWPRVGVTYYNLSTDDTATSGTTTTNTYYGLAVNIEPGFVYTPVPHFGVTLFPVADIPLMGGHSRKEEGGPTPDPPTDRGLTIRNFGAMLGVLGYF